MAQRMKLRGFPLWINAGEHDGAVAFTAEPLNEIQTTQVWYHWKAGLHEHMDVISRSKAIKQ